MRTHNIRHIMLLSFLLFWMPVLHAQIRVSGKVIDEEHNPLVGVGVLLKGTTQGTVTAEDGTFEIDVPDSKSVLGISCIGFIEQEVPVGDRDNLVIVLKVDAQTLDEVVAIGYATVRKSDLTGSVAKVDMDELNKAQTLSFDQALGGRVAGVHVVTSDGQPGAQANIVIRGSNTISETSDGSPLYVIDGFASDDVSLASISPNDIESIDILKDASATAIYGARGANGVIIVTTKRGSESAPRVTYEGYISYQEKPRFMELMDGYEFVSWQEELQGADELRRTYYRFDPDLGRCRTLEDYRSLPYTDWQDVVFRAAPMTSHHLSLTGGTRTTKYSASVSYYNQQGIIINSSYGSLKARATLDQQIARNLKGGLTINFSDNTSIGSAPSQGGGGSTQYFLYQVLAYLPVQYADEESMETELTETDPNYPYNPIKTIRNQYSRIKSKSLTMNAYLTWNIREDLILRGTFSYNWRNDRSGIYNSGETYWGDPKYQAKHSNGEFRYKEWNQWSNEYTLTYHRKVNGHNINAMLGASINSRTVSTLGAYASMVPWDELGFWGISGGTPYGIDAINFTDRIASGFARLNYDWKSRYLLTATIRADGTSRFPYHTWGWFPSASFAWKISDEPFMSGAGNWLSVLKLRIGWGATGNCNTYRNYPSIRLYNSDQSYPVNGDVDNNPAIYYAQMANRDMKWETTYQTNIGLDYSFFGNRINGEIDIYRKDTEDLLLDAEVPPSTGFTKVQQNIGSIRNRGLEFTVNTVNLKGGRGRLEWRSSFNISFNRSTVTALSGDQDYWISGVQYPTVSNLYIARVGHPLSEMYGYVYDGVYQYSDFNEVSPNVFVLRDDVPDNTNERSQIQPGDIKLKDINGDGKVTPEDQTVIGHGLPVHTGGFTNDFEYMGFDLSIFLQWSYGNDVINYNRAQLEDMTSRNANRLASALDHWTPRTDNGDGTYTEGNYTNYLWGAEGDLRGINTDRVVEDASFLRIKNVQIGYTFPEKLLRRMKISGMRIYLSGQNLFTWTRYTGYDPEVSTRNSALTKGFDYSSYPKTRSYTIGVKVTF